MNYQHVIKGTFISRPNRFLAHVALPGGEVVCHVKNTGRCRELLIPGVTVILEFHPDAEALGRKTKYSLIAVYKENQGQDTLINMDSQVPNLATYEWLCGGKSSLTGKLTNIRREVTFGQSRFDLAFDRNGIPAFMEVKGVTLEQDGIAMFPDAPTERGIKHVMELCRAAELGYEAYILFVIQMKGVSEFQPNVDTQPAFGRALVRAQAAGVQVWAYDCLVVEDGIEIDGLVNVNLEFV